MSTVAPADTASKEATTATIDDGVSPEIHVSDRSSSVASFKVMDVLKRANQLQASGHQVLHCEVGQPETGAPTKVREAALAALSVPTPQVMGYTDAFGLLALRQKICDHYQSSSYYSLDGDKNSISSLDPSRIVVTTGSSGAFLLAFTACFDVGDVVAIASCGYPCYRNILKALGCQLLQIPVNDQFKLTARELRRAIQEEEMSNNNNNNNTTTKTKIRGLILSSPSNPTGAMLTPDELKELCELCDEHQIQFLSDEIYHGIYCKKEAPPEATALQYSPNVIIINSFSKYYSMPGWRLGWMIVPHQLIDPINKLQQNMFINAPTISQVAAMQCWEPETITELNQHVQKYLTSRTLILHQLALIPEINPKNIAPAHGGFYIYVDLGEDNVVLPHVGSVAMCKALLEEEHVAFTPGNDFESTEELGNRRFRISYAGGIDTLRQAMERFARFWPTWMERVQAARSSAP